MFDLRRREFITLLGGAAAHGRSPRARSSASGCGASASCSPSQENDPAPRGLLAGLQEVDGIRLG